MTNINNYKQFSLLLIIFQKRTCQIFALNPSISMFGYTFLIDSPYIILRKSNGIVIFKSVKSGFLKYKISQYNFSQLKSLEH